MRNEGHILPAQSSDIVERVNKKSGLQTSYRTRDGLLTSVVQKIDKLQFNKSIPFSGWLGEIYSMPPGNIVTDLCLHPLNSNNVSAIEIVQKVGMKTDSTVRIYLKEAKDKTTGTIKINKVSREIISKLNQSDDVMDEEKNKKEKIKEDSTSLILVWDQKEEKFALEGQSKRKAFRTKALLTINDLKEIGLDCYPVFIDMSKDGVDVIINSQNQLTNISIPSGISTNLLDRIKQDELMQPVEFTQSYEDLAINILGKERVFGQEAIRVFENRIFELTGSKVKFSSKSTTSPPDAKEIEKEEKSLNKLIYIPDTMLVTEKRGIPVDNPEEKPITIGELFELFCDKKDAEESRLQLLAALKKRSSLTPNVVAKKPELVDEAKKILADAVKIRDEVVNKFKGGILDFSLLEDIIDSKFDSKIQGGWHFIGDYKNEDLLDLESFASNKGAKIPTLMELIMVQLILSTNEKTSEGWTWFPTESLVKVPVQEPKRRPLNISGRNEYENYIEYYSVKGRLFVTSSKERGVGIAILRDDIPQYRRNVLTIK